MITLNPEIAVYSPPPVLFGGIEVERRPHKVSELTAEIKTVLKILSTALYNAYSFKSRIDAQDSIVSYKGSPTSSVFNKGYKDYDIAKEAEAERTLRRVLLKNKESALLMREDFKGVYFLQLLKDKFEPEVTANLLVGIEAAIFEMFGYRKPEYDINITSRVHNDVLNVDAKVVARLKYVI